MKNTILAFIFLTSSLSLFSQHDVYLNFFDFLGQVNTVGYRYHLTDYTSLGGEISFSDKSDMRLVSNAKKKSFFQASSEYLVFFSPKKGCDKFYVGPNLAYRNSKGTYEYTLDNELRYYDRYYKSVLLSLSVGSIWRHKSGFFFNASGTLGRSIYSSFVTTQPGQSNGSESLKNNVVFRLGLNIGWQFGAKAEKK